MSLGNDLDKKFDSLLNYLSSLESVMVAFSAGVDSTFLLKAAHIALSNQVFAITAKSPLFPKRELDESVEFCKGLGVCHIIIDIDISKIRDNPPNRCYICKYGIFSKFLDEAKKLGVKHVLEGSNIDDEGDYRPGIKAVNELKIKSPLKEFGFSKAEIRLLSKKLGLKTSEKPSFACLASRFPYGEEISETKLEMVSAAEEFLFQNGFKQFRVRIQGESARIEVLPDDFNKILDLRAFLTSEFKKAGFKYVSLDLDGYRMGSMNEGLNLKR